MAANAVALRIWVDLQVYGGNKPEFPVLIRCCGNGVSPQPIGEYNKRSRMLETGRV